MTQCAICLNEVRQTRNSKAIRCGHIFHSHCLEKWKNKGNVTCPICRKVFDGSKFRVQITVLNDYESTSNTVSVSNEFIFDKGSKAQINKYVQNKGDAKNSIKNQMTNKRIDKIILFLFSNCFCFIQF